MLASFHVPEAGLEYEAAAMPTAPAPESISLSYDDFTEAEMGIDGPWGWSLTPICAQTGAHAPLSSAAEVADTVVRNSLRPRSW